MHVYRSSTAPLILDAQATLTDPAVLPGFRVRVRAFFDYNETSYWTITNRSGCWVGYVAAPREAEMLVRCWFSPIEPPTPDRLSDFA